MSHTCWITSGPHSHDGVDVDGADRLPGEPRATGFLGRLLPTTRQEVLDHGRPRRYEPGDRILREGDRDRHVILLTSGFVKVTTHIEGIEALVAIRGAGDIVGEAAALSDQPRMASVIACGKVTARLVTAEAFGTVLIRYPDVARLVTITLAERLRWANDRRADFVAFPVEVRLARVLVEISVRFGRRAAHEAVAIDVPLSQRELATMVGASEDTVQKALRALRRAGLIHSTYRRLTVLDPAGLRRMSRHVR